MTTFTSNEIAFLKMVINYDDRETQKCDNYSNAGHEEAATLFNGDMKAAGGLLSSLTKKGIGWCEKEDDYDLFWLNEDAIDTVYDALGLE